MTERPILFSGPMVRALLDGKKTQTRRLATSPLRKCEVGDRLWVRETFCYKVDPVTSKLVTRDGTYECWYRATNPEVDFEDDGDGYAVLNKDGTPKSPWRPSIHMPRWASRLTLVEVTDVRFQRLQEITDAEAAAEGGPYCGDRCGFQGCGCHPDWPELFNSRRDGFQHLWDSLHAKDGHDWVTNPEVVALTFRRVEA